MEHQLTIYNTLTRRKEIFKPLHAPHVGMYVCGPTVYGDPHLGHARPAITFDILFRYLKHLGYKVRYVRNITDVGHLEHDADEGEDKIAKKARLEQLEPMEVAQYYANRYHEAMDALGVLRPSIEPQASGHIIEQIELVKEILKNGYAYESKGSVYALWKNAQPEHIMRWPSPWGNGFPGWHCECTAMGRKYLGEHFDIHGGGMDLIFPHHECEIAQSVASQGDDMVHYWMHNNMLTVNGQKMGKSYNNFIWMHNNMLTVNGQKMGKSYNNFITLEQLFTGTHPLLEQAYTPMTIRYTPMTIRFFTLQAHYRSTVDFGNEALKAAEKGLARLMDAVSGLEKITPAQASTVDVKALREKCYDAMDDDLNTPIVIAHLFDGAKMVNNILAGNDTITAADLNELKETFRLFCFDILGLKAENASNAAREEAFGHVVDMLLEERAKAKANKDWATSDKIRNELTALGFEIKDGKDGSEWKLNK